MPPIPVPVLTGDLAQQLEALLCPLAEQIATEEFAALVPSLLAAAARDPELAPFHAGFLAAHGLSDGS